jgi:hypothetical protein
VTTAECTAHVTGTRTTLRHAIAGFALAALVTSGAAACKPVTLGTPAAAAASRAAPAFTSAPASSAAPTSARASSALGCTQALEAASTYGPTAVQDAGEGRDLLDKAEIDLIVLLLNKAANSAGDSAVKQTIVNLVTDYLELRDSLSDAVDSAIGKKILADTANLKSRCAQ